MGGELYMKEFTLPRNLRNREKDAAAFLGTLRHTVLPALGLFSVKVEMFEQSGTKYIEVVMKQPFKKVSCYFTLAGAYFVASALLRNGERGQSVVLVSPNHMGHATIPAWAVGKFMGGLADLMEKYSDAFKEAFQRVQKIIESEHMQFEATKQGDGRTIN